MKIRLVSRTFFKEFPDEPNSDNSLGTVLFKCISKSILSSLWCLSSLFSQLPWLWGCFQDYFGAWVEGKGTEWDNIKLTVFSDIYSFLLYKFSLHCFKFLFDTIIFEKNLILLAFDSILFVLCRKMNFWSPYSAIPKIVLVAKNI